MQTKKEHSRIAVTAIISAVFIFILSISQIYAEPYVYYHLDGDGTDAGSNGLDLTVNEDQLIWVEGIHGQAAFIKLVSDNNPLSMEEMYENGDWTFEAWVKFENLDDPSYNYIFFYAGWFCFTYDAYSGPAAINFSFPDSDFYFLDKIRYQLPNSFIGKWFHLAGVYREGESIQFYVNGEKIGEKILSYNMDFSQYHLLNIGKYDWGIPSYEITIDEVAIHNEALDPEDFIGLQYNVEYPLYTINGQITDSSSGEGLPGAIVIAEPGGYLVSTDSNGVFAIDLPSDGEFNISVKKSNYTSASKQDIVVTADNPATTNVALECISTSPIIADYHFDGNGEDASVNGYDLAVHDSVTWTDGVQGKAAVLYNMYNDPEFIPAFDSGINRPLYPGIGDFSCEALMYIHDSKVDNPFFYISNESYAIRTWSSRTGVKQIKVYLSSYDGEIEFTVPLADYYDNWIHIALVYRYKQIFQFYINGELIAEEVTDLVPGIYPFVPGKYSEYTFRINASDKYIIDEIRISNTALSPEQFLFMETSVEESPSPSEFVITGNYPNPFNPSTTIEFTIPETGFINLAIYNITGQKIRELVTDTMPAGNHSVMWDGRDDNGMMVSSGIYMSRLASGGNVTSKRMLLMK